MCLDAVESVIVELHNYYDEHHVSHQISLQYNSYPS